MIITDFLIFNAINNKATHDTLDNFSNSFNELLGVSFEVITAILQASEKLLLYPWPTYQNNSIKEKWWCVQSYGNGSVNILFPVMRFK